jgi:hypothetical protein
LLVISPSVVNSSSVAIAMTARTSVTAQAATTRQG